MLCLKFDSHDLNYELKSHLSSVRTMLPATVCISAGPFLEDAMPLTISERVSVGSIEEERMRELQNGRAYAKRALAMLGIQNVELPMASDRSPVWPAGVVGSITHVTGRGNGHFAAAVARTQDVCAVGIDIEPENGIHPHLWNYFLTESELKRIIALPSHMRTTEAQVTWCAKEAITKAARRQIEPTEVDIERNTSDGGFSAIWRPNGPEKRPAEIWRGRTARSQGSIFAVVVRSLGPTPVV